MLGGGVGPERPSRGRVAAPGLRLSVCCISEPRWLYSTVAHRTGCLPGPAVPSAGQGSGHLDLRPTQGPAPDGAPSAATASMKGRTMRGLRGEAFPRPVVARPPQHAGHTLRGWFWRICALTGLEGCCQCAVLGQRPRMSRWLLPWPPPCASARVTATQAATQVLPDGLQLLAGAERGREGAPHPRHSG